MVQRRFYPDVEKALTGPPSAAHSIRHRGLTHLDYNPSEPFQKYASTTNPYHLTASFRSNDWLFRSGESPI